MHHNVTRRQALAGAVGIAAIGLPAGAQAAPEVKSVLPELPDHDATSPRLLAYLREWAEYEAKGDAWVHENRSTIGAVTDVPAEFRNLREAGSRAIRRFFLEPSQSKADIRLKLETADKLFSGRLSAVPLNADMSAAISGLLRDLARTAEGA